VYLLESVIVVVRSWD